MPLPATDFDFDFDRKTPMYLPKHFEEQDPARLHALMRSHPLATWVVQGPEGLVVNHVPFHLEDGPDGAVRLSGHVARANPVWSLLDGQSRSVMIFQGPQAYITPSFYPAKREHGKVVPTWNYAVVHAHGVASTYEDRARLHALVSRLTDQHESREAQPWAVDDAPTDYVDAMLRAIVGVEFRIERLVGKWKMTQNRVEADRVGVAQGLQARGDEESRAAARMIHPD